MNWYVVLMHESLGRKGRSRPLALGKRLTTFPNSAAPLFNLSALCDALRDEKAARVYYSRAITLAPAADGGEGQHLRNPVSADPRRHVHDGLHEIRHRLQGERAAGACGDDQ